METICDLGISTWSLGCGDTDTGVGAAVFGYCLSGVGVGAESSLAVFVSQVASDEVRESTSGSYVILVNFDFFLSVSMVFQN